jgi:glutamyl-tRNA reductase
MNRTATNISHFFVAGINYKKADATMRGQFAINEQGYENILNLAPFSNVDSLFILSTCNRTEIYGCVQNAQQLMHLLCTQTTSDVSTLKSMGYVKSGIQAIEHLFNVSAGLDSQILGDYEIVGQLKHAVKFAKDRGHLNCFTERLVNGALQSSKTIKNETRLSDGTISVSFAAVQYLKENVTVKPDTKILVVGIGKIGRNTCKNLVDYLGTTNIVLINRSENKAKELASELGLQQAPLAELGNHVASSDIILVATNAEEPIILKSQLENQGKKLVIDLSIPYNVESAVSTLPDVTLINVDEISKIKDNTLKQREAETPKAKAIIAEHIAVFMDWCLMRQNAPALKVVKTQLNDIYVQHLSKTQTDQHICAKVDTDEIIQRTINVMAGKMRADNQRGCQSIAAMNEFIVSVCKAASA